MWFRTKPVGVVKFSLAQGCENSNLRCRVKPVEVVICGLKQSL